jgi:hypothetical protein
VSGEAAEFRWKLTDLEFKLLCEDSVPGGLPSPFVYTSRTRFADDYEAERAAVRAAPVLPAGPERDALLGALARPDLVIVVHAWNTRYCADPRHRIRLHAARRGTRGFLVRQRPGETLEHAGGFDIAECAAGDLGRVALAMLPRAAAGRDPGAVRAELAATGTQPYAGESVVTQGAGPPVTDAGFVKVVQGHLGFREPGLAELGTGWRDIPGDGRYVLTVGAPVATAVGMDSPALADRVDAQMAYVLSRLAS